MMLVCPGVPVRLNWNVPLVLTKVPDIRGGVGDPTLTVAEAKFSSGFGSGGSALTMAEFSMLPALLARTTSVSCAPALVASVPMFQTTSNPLRVTEPCVLLLETRLTLDGRVSDTMALLLADGP